MKQPFLIIFFNLLSLSILGEEYILISKESANEMLQKIAEKSSSIESFHCDFIETKSISVLNDKQLSAGEMFYLKPDRLKWEYLSPFQFIFVSDQGEITVLNNNKLERGESGVGAAFKEISKIIFGTINGEKLVDESKFTAEYFSDNNSLKIALVPKNRKMRQFINEITFIFSTKDHYIHSITLKQGEDTTEIKLNNKRINQPINEELFIIKT